MARSLTRKVKDALPDVVQSPFDAKDIKDKAKDKHKKAKKKIERFSKSLWRGMSVENASRVQRARGFAGHPGSKGGDIGRGVYFARTKRDAMDYAKPLKNGRGTPKSSRRIGRVAEVEEGKVRPLWEGGASPKWTHRASHTDGRPGRGTGLSTYPQVTIDPKDAKKLKLKRIENVNATTVERTMSRGLHPSGKTRYQVHREQQAAQYGGTKEERRARLASKKKKSSGTIYPNSFGKSLEQSPRMDAMSTSAFGIEHGEISKGIGPTGPVRQALPKVRPLGPGLGKAKPSTQETLRAKAGQAYRDAAKAKAGPGQAGRPRQPSGSRSRYNFTRAIDDL